MTAHPHTRLIEDARGISIADELLRRGILLKRIGRELIGPCPVCGGTDRFGVNLRKQLWNCRGCHVGGDVIDLVRHLDACSVIEACVRLTGDSPATARRVPRNPPSAAKSDPDDNHQALADRIWHRTGPLTPAARAYLARRGIVLDDVPEDAGLRFDPCCPWGSGDAPCVIARFTTAIKNEPRGIWRRPLNGDKPKSLGPTSGCVIRLWPDDAIEQSLVLGEGVETTLAAATRIIHRGTLLRPAWATGSAGNMACFPVLAGIECLTLLVDNDFPDTHGKRRGQHDAGVCAARWQAAGREVLRLMSERAGEDLNDCVMRGVA
jgi:hypothetical protein